MEVLVRYGEIALKGKNRRYFEKKLAENIKKGIKSIEIKGKVRRLQGRILITGLNKDAKKLLKPLLKRIFGISSFSFAYSCEVDNITPAVDLLIKSLNSESTFRVSARRVIKKGPTSQELKVKIGKHISEKTKARVDLTNFDQEIGIEIHDRAYVFSKTHKGAGGLPLGTQGKAICVINNKQCAEAMVRVMRRGVKPIIICKDNKLIDEVRRWAPGLQIPVFKSINSVKIKEVNALVVDDKIETIKSVDTELLVLRPLI